MQEELEGLFLIHVLIIVIGYLGIDEYSPEKIDKNSVSYREPIEGLLDANKLTRLEYFEELKEESLELKIIKNGLFVGFEENKSKIRVEEELL